MNLIDLMQTDVPTEVTLDGKVKGTLIVKLGRASNLARVVRFGADSFGKDQIVTVNGMTIDVAGACVFQHEGAFQLTHASGGFRRGDWLDRKSFTDDIPAKSRALLVAALVEQAAKLADLFPDAFTRYGMADSYRTADSARSQARSLAEDARILARYADIGEAVDEGRATVVPRRAGDEAPAEVRWNKPRSRDCTIRSIDSSQPRPVAGLVIAADGELLGYAVDTESTRGFGNGPDCYAGPLLLPLDLAVAVDQNTTRW